MLKTSLACAMMLALGACAGGNKTCPSDELRPDQRTGQLRGDEEGTAETVIPPDGQERTIILIPVPEGELTDEETQENVMPAPGEPDSGADPQAPTIFLIPIEPDEGEQPTMPENGGGLQEDLVPEAEGDVTSETLVPREAPPAEPAPPASDPKDIYF